MIELTGINDFIFSFYFAIGKYENEHILIFLFSCYNTLTEKKEVSL